jgi:glutamate-1-semialdehyde 2,1-aminomutase
MNLAQAATILRNDFYAAMKERAAELEARYRALTPRSAEMHERACAVLPGGYTRDAVMRKPYTPYLVEGRGSEVKDIDGRRYIDFCYNATSLVLGHAEQQVVDALNRQARLGTAYQAQNVGQVELAELLCERLPSAELVRFTNSGSEAVMMAIRIARGFTGRDLLIKFEGSYHGTYDDVQWSVNPPKPQAAGQPASPVPDTAGLPPSGDRLLVLPYNDPAAVERALANHGSELAAIIVEPMANRMGLIVPQREFLEAVVRGCRAVGAVAIFDEVIAFRLGYNGSQGTLGIVPDLTTLGKCIGGGLPVGAIAGRRDILQCTDPKAQRRVTHAGTFNGNPMTMAAGLVTMEALTLPVFERLNGMGETLRAKLRSLFDGLPLTVSGTGSLFKVNAIGRPITNYQDSVEVDGEWQQVVSIALANEGFLLSKGLQGCVSTVTTEEEIDDLVGAFAAILRA